ncbi:MAG TPA: GHMP kinase, partial [Vicinamibacteria bacterium]
MNRRFVARAPARLDVMGGIADYSGSLVLELPLRESTRVVLEREDSERLTLASTGRPEFAIPLADLDRSYESARAYFGREPSRAWAAYVAGAFVVLKREKGAVFPGGARVAI